MRTSNKLSAVMPLLCASLTYFGFAIAQAEPMVFLTTYQAGGSSSRTASIIKPKLEEYLQRPIELDIDATLDESLRGSAIAFVVAPSSRIPLLPRVPTMLEWGITSVPHGSWAGLFVPAGTSDHDLAELFAAVDFAMADPSVVQQINELGMEVSLSESPQAYAEYLEAEGVRLRNAVEKYRSI